MSHDSPHRQDPTIPPAHPPFGSPPVTTKAAARKPSRLKNYFTVLVALVALLLSGGAAFLAWQANGTANDTAERLAALGDRPPSPAAVPTTDPVQPVDPAPTTEEATADPPPPTDPGSASPRVINRQTQFDVFYGGKQLRIPATGCSDPIYVDFDQPAVQVDASVAEVHFGVPCGNGTPFMHLQDGVDGSAATERVTPADCTESNYASPLLKDGNHPIRPGQVYCIASNANEARTAGIPRKMLIISVNGVGQDNAISLRVSAWSIPD